MEFTYSAYRNLIKLLHNHGYKICGYTDYDVSEKSAILRHDIDTSVDKAVDMAYVEQDEGVSATYFILISTDFYNINSQKTSEALKKFLNWEENLLFISMKQGII